MLLCFIGYVGKIDGSFTDSAIIDSNVGQN